MKNKNFRLKSSRPSWRSHAPRLRFGPRAWAKFVCWRDAGPTEIGAFGISSANDQLLVEDVEIVEQQCTATTVTFFDDAVADYFDAKLDQGIQLARCSRIWLHTHPGDSAMPSTKDEETFQRVFGKCDWAVMAILARSGQSYARLRFALGPCLDMRLKVEVDYSQPFEASDHSTWLAQYKECVQLAKKASVFGNHVCGTDRRFEDPLILDENYERYF